MKAAAAILGKKVRDKITLTEGTATAINISMSGTVQVLIEGQGFNKWVESDRVEVYETAPVSAPGVSGTVEIPGKTVADLLEAADVTEREAAGKAFRAAQKMQHVQREARGLKKKLDNINPNALSKANKADLEAGKKEAKALEDDAALALDDLKAFL